MKALTSIFKKKTNASERPQQAQALPCWSPRENKQNTTWQRNDTKTARMLTSCRCACVSLTWSSVSRVRLFIAFSLACRHKRKGKKKTGGEWNQRTTAACMRRQQPKQNDHYQQLTTENRPLVKKPARKSPKNTNSGHKKKEKRDWLPAQ